MVAGRPCFSDTKEIAMNNNENTEQISKTVEELKRFSAFMQAMEENDELADAVVDAIDGYASTVLSLAQKMAPGLTKLGVKVVKRYAEVFGTVAKTVDEHKDDLREAFKAFGAAMNAVAPAPKVGEDDFSDYSEEVKNAKA
jgi:dGTP triphosphohydrolase